MSKRRIKKRSKKIDQMDEMCEIDQMDQIIRDMYPIEDMLMNNIKPMNMNKRDNLNINSNLGNIGKMMMQNNLNYLNGFGDNNIYRFMNNNFKTIQIFYKGHFIQNVDIYENEEYSSISEKVKSILYTQGIKLYRKPFRDEVVKRASPFETLENLLERGVIEKNPGIIIIHKGLRYPGYTFNYYQLKNGDIFYIELENKLYGGGCLSIIEFLDVDESTKPKNLDFSESAPEWRRASIGLNLFGKCINKKCEAYKEEVIYPAGINIKFDFNSDIKKIKCPICSKNFIPMTMGFWKCEYQIKGEKFRKGDYEEVEIIGKETKGDDFEYYNPYENSTTYWSRLMIFTGHRQKMKYEKFAI